MLQQMQIHIVYSHTHIAHTHTHTSMYLYKAKLSPTENIADRWEGAYSQQDIQAKPQNPHRIVGVRAPGHGGVKLICYVFLDLKVTGQRQVLTLHYILTEKDLHPKQSLTCDIVISEILCLT